VPIRRTLAEGEAVPAPHEEGDTLVIPLLSRAISWTAGCTAQISTNCLNYFARVVRIQPNVSSPTGSPE
jgi:hypothetical protein